MALPVILPNQDISPLEVDGHEERGPLDPPLSLDRFSLVWYLFFQGLANSVNNNNEKIVLFTPVTDCLKGTMGAMTASSKTLVTVFPDPPFTKDMLRKPISVFGAGNTVYAKNSVTGSPVALAAGDILLTFISAISADGRTATLANAAVHTVTQTQWACGTDNTPAYNDAMQTLRDAGGGNLLFDPNGEGDAYFATVGWVGVFGDNYIDRVDFSNLHIWQGAYTIVFGAPMGYLEINQSVFNQWALVDSGPAIADITAPVAQGDMIISVDPSQLVDGSGNLLFHRDDYILISTGYIGTFYFGFALPDAQIAQIVFADVDAGTLILAEPTLKPFVQEVYPNWDGVAAPAPTPGTDAPFQVMNVTDILIHNFQYDGLKVNTFFFTDLLTGGQCSGMYINQGDLLTRGTWHSMNYVRRGITQGIRAFIDNLHSPRLPFDYAFTFAVGTSQVIFKDSEINSTGTTYLHIHEGAADCKVSKVTLGNFNGNPDDAAIQPVSVRGRSYGLKVTDCYFTGWDVVSVVYIEDSCVAGGLFLNCTIGGRNTPTALLQLDVESYGTGWRLDFPSVPVDRIYQYSTNIQPPILRLFDAILNSVEGLNGLTSALGGFGQSGNILTESNDLTAGFWNAATGVTVTANTTDILDPLGGNTASKVETGPTSANMEVAYDALTPAPGVVTGTGNNADRTFVLVFYVYSPIQNQMEYFLGSFVSAVGLDLTNTIVKKIGVYPQWQRVELIVPFGPSAVTGTEILVGLASAVYAPIVGLNSTFYFWGVTLQEYFGPQPLITVTNGLQVPYTTGLLAGNGHFLGDVTIDGTLTIAGAGFTAHRPIIWDGTTFVTLKIDGSDSNYFVAGVSAGLVASTGTTGVLTDATAAMVASLLGLTTAELSYLSGVTSSIQAQLNGLATAVADLQAQTLDLYNTKADHGTYGVVGGGGGNVTI